MPKVSIIVPVYKTPKKFLDRCIKSILSQTLRDIEPIFVDDGSQEECGGILDDVAMKDKRVKVIHQKNGGLCAARNSGFRVATGEWITFVDADDFIELNTCEKLVAAAEDEDTQLIMCGLQRDYSNSSTPYEFYLKEKTYTAGECKWLQEQLLHYNGNIACVYAKLIRRSYLVEYNILHDEELRQGEEGLEFNFRLFNHLTKAVFIKDCLYHYVYNDISITAISTLKNNEYVINCYKRIKSYVLQSEQKDKLIPWFHNRMMYIIVTTAISGYFNPSIELKYAERKRYLEAFLELPIVKETMESRDYFDLSRARRITFSLIKRRCFFLLLILGKTRRYQKQHA